MARKRSGQTSGLHPPGFMHNGLGPGQDGFSGIPDRTPMYHDGNCTLEVGRDEAEAMDARGKPGVPPGVKQSY